MIEDPTGVRNWSPAAVLDSPPVIERLELSIVRMPLREPFRAAHGTSATREVLLVHVLAGGLSGWGLEGWAECVAPVEPTYSEEYVAGALDVIQRWLGPALVGRPLLGAGVCRWLAGFRGHPMAKAALEAAVLDAELRGAGMSLASWLGATRSSVPAGVAVGLAPSETALRDELATRQAEGYRRVKLKIAPGADLRPLEVARETLGPDIVLDADANGAYGREDRAVLEAVGVHVALLEQPLAREDLLGHRDLRPVLACRVGLDESVTGPESAELAFDLEAAGAVSLKAGRVGGVVAARCIHDLAVRRQVPLLAGGMLETGVGRALALAVAALPGVSLIGDLSASARYWEEDVTAPFDLRDGYLPVPDGPGLGVEVRQQLVEKWLVDRVVVDEGTGLPEDRPA